MRPGLLLLALKDEVTATPNSLVTDIPSNVVKVTKFLP
jgi:hypothetical protein